MYIEQKRKTKFIFFLFLESRMLSEHEPRLTEPLNATYLIREGQPVKLSCRFDANPTGDIQWLKNGIPIDFEALGISRDFKVSRKSCTRRKLDVSYVNRWLEKWITQHY